LGIEFSCKSCGSVLRVSEEHAGKHAKCPSCSHINLIPGETEELADSQSDATGSDFSQPISGTASDPNPFQSPHSQYTPPVYQGAHYIPHRGSMVFTMGMVSVIGNILLCCVFPLLSLVMIVPGIIAWTCGSRDLAKINSGEMDPTGRSMTQSGMVLGIVGTVIAILEIVMGGAFLVLIAAGGFGGI